jgi:hypothetical protein
VSPWLMKALGPNWLWLISRHSRPEVVIVITKTATQVGGDGI